jgi:hypothetical protein
MKILVLADQRQRLRSQINLVEQLIKYDPKLSVTIIVACEYTESDFTRILNYNNIEIIYLFKQKINISSKNIIDKKNKINFFVKKFIKNTTIGQIFYAFVLALKMISYLRIAEKYITLIKPDILLVNSDRMGVSLEQAFLKKSKKYAIKSIVPYTSVISNGISLRLASLNLYSVQTILDKILFKILKNQTKNIDGKIIKFYDSSTTIILKLFGLLSLNPWMIENGLVDYVCIDSLYSFNKYKDDILFPEKFKIVGDIEYDILYYHSITQIKYLKTNYAIDDDLPNIIIALPQLAEHSILSWEKHWQEIYFILDELRDVNANIFLSLHPKMDLNKYIHLEKMYPCIILKEQLRDVIHEADLFMAINSSTVLWSTILGIKTIVLDYFGLDSSYFKDLSSIQFIKEKKNLKKLVMNTLVSNINFVEDFKSLSKDDIFDGKTIQRYIELMKEK